MSAAQEEKKVLAIAVMRDGQVVNKLIPDKDAVTLGTGYNNNIAIETEGVPDSMDFIAPGSERESWVLRLTDTMDAQITSSDGAKLKFSDLKGLGIFPTDDLGHYMLNIKYGDQGQVTVGAYIVHFGFIKPPKKPKPKPRPKPSEPKLEIPSREPIGKDLALKITVERPGEKRQEIFPNAGIMTIGDAEYNTVPVKGLDLPRIHTLLEPKDGKYILRLLPDIKGGVEVSGSVIPFKTLIERNLLKREKEGEPYIWEFDKNVSGIFSLGDVEVFFGFEEPPAEAKPKAVSKAMPKHEHKPTRYDWDIFATRPHDGIVFKGQKEESSRFEVVLGVGLALALLVGATFDRIVVVKEPSKSQILRRAPSARVASLSENPTEQITEGAGEEIISDIPVAETVSGVSGGGPAGASGGPAGVAAGQEAADQVIQSIGFAAYGTGTAGGGAGLVADLQSAASAGYGLASGQSGDALLAGGGGGGSGGISALVGTGGGVLESAETVSASEVEAVHRAAQVSFSASGSGEALDLGQRNMSDIRRKINVVKMRVQTAYESLLRSNPSAGGTISVSFSITPSGSVTGVSVSAPAQLQSLVPTIQSAVSSLNFGAAEGQTSNLSISVPFNLVPPE